VGWCGQGNSIIVIRFEANLVDVETSKTTVIPSSNGLFRAQCSPDGHYLAAVTQDGMKLRLYEFVESARHLGIAIAIEKPRCGLRIAPHKHHSRPPGPLPETVDFEKLHAPMPALITQ